MSSEIIIDEILPVEKATYALKFLDGKITFYPTYIYYPDHSNNKEHWKLRATEKKIEVKNLKPQG